MTRIAALGEMLIDFVSTQAGSLMDAPAFVAAPGGAPANVAVGIARQGVPCSFLGKVGNDTWGHLLAQTLEREGVDVTGVCFSDKARTALAFVSLQEDGERDFLFYRHPSADMLYEPSEVNEAIVKTSTIIHTGSISLITEPSCSATYHAVELAQQHGALFSYDPNLRLPLWESEETARTTIMQLWTKANIIKVSEEELFFLSQLDDQDKAIEQLWHDNIRLLAITQGAEGCTCITPTFRVTVLGFSVQTIDTTGAGDSWIATLLAQIAQNPDLLTSSVALEQALRYANAAAALTTTNRGAIPALPTPADVDGLLRG